MREVGGAGREHDFGVAGQIEVAGAVAVIGDRHAPQLDVVFGRDDHFGARLEAGVEAPQDGAVERELTSYSSASRPDGWCVVDHTSPLSRSRTKTKLPQLSLVMSSRQRVSASCWRRL